MIYFLQKYRLLQIVFIIGLTGFFIFRMIKLPICFVEKSLHLPYAQSLEIFCQQHPFFYFLFIILFIFLQVTVLQIHFQHNGFADQPTKIPIVTWMAFAVSGSIFLPLSPIFIINTVIIFLLPLTIDTQRNSAKTKLLLSGILIGIATLYDLVAILLLIYMLFFILTNSLNKIKDFLVVISGCITTYLYVFSYQLLTNNLLHFCNMMRDYRFTFPLFTSTHFTWLSILAIIAIILSLPFFLLRLKLIFDNKLIIIRKRLISVHLLLAVTVIMIFISSIPFPQSIGYILVPYSIYISAIAPGRRIYPIKEIVVLSVFAAIIVLGIWG